MDGSPTTKGDVIYLVNTLKMQNGREPDSPDPNYKVPVLKFVIGDDAPDNSLIPMAMRPLPPVPDAQLLKQLIDDRRVFRLDRRSAGGENEWVINGQPFDPHTVLRDQKGRLVQPKRGSWEVWEFQNGGGGWVHPLHIHQEEHRVLLRNGKNPPDARHPDDRSREDVVALDKGASSGSSPASTSATATTWPTRTTP